jgi:Flp pilus assembly protein TadD
MYEAARVFPTNSDPYVLLGSYYRELKNYAGAREAFTKALDRARELQNVQLIDAIGKEVSSLPQ